MVSRISPQAERQQVQRPPDSRSPMQIPHPRTRLHDQGLSWHFLVGLEDSPRPRPEVQVPGPRTKGKTPGFSSQHRLDKRGFLWP